MRSRQGDGGLSSSSKGVSTGGEDNVGENLQIEENRVQFPSVSTRRTAPLGPFLSPRTTSSEAGSSYLARSGLPLLASSESFVATLSEETDSLLQTFVQAWNSEKADLSSSPFSIFKRVYRQRGWHHFQLYWSENAKTRQSIYDAFIRTLTDRLRPLLDLINVDTTKTVQLHLDKARVTSKQDLLEACGVVFALKTVQSTTALVASDNGFESVSGRISIEADLFHILMSLPQLLIERHIFPMSPDGDTLQPLDDVVFILRDLTHADGPNPSSHNGSIESAGSGPVARGVFDLLAPTTYNARPAAVNNRVSTKGDFERQKGLWGSRGRSDNGEGSKQLSRPELIQHIIKRKLDMYDEFQSVRTPRQRSELLQREERAAEKAFGEQRGTEKLKHQLEIAESQKRLYEDGKSKSFGHADLANLPLGDSDAAALSLHTGSVHLTGILALAQRHVELSVQSSSNTLN